MATQSIQRRKKTVRVIVLISLLVFFFVLFGGSPSTENIGLPWETLIQRHSNPKEQIIENLKFKWLLKRNFLPNFYTRKHDQKNLVKWPPDELYQNSTIVFVHNQKSGGSTTKRCLEKLMTLTNNPPPAMVANPNADDFYTLMLSQGVHQDLARSYMGDSTFGMCDFSNKPCSYFTILRDPYERVISSHNMCRLIYAQQCDVRNASKLSIREWAIHQGSFFFRQLLANPLFFTNKFLPLVNILRTPEDPPTDEIPPWWRNELILNHLMTEKQKGIVLDFVLDRLQWWFAVIGITDEYDTSLALFERVYQLPFHSQCAGEIKNKRQYKMEGQGPLLTKEKVAEKLIAELSADPVVNEAMRYDIEIFRKAKDIFRLQKLVYENKL